MFNVSQLYSITQFLRANFKEVNYNERAFITIKEKKKRSCFLQYIMGKNINTFNKKLTAVMQQKI